MKSFGSINISNSYIENINNYNVTESRREDNGTAADGCDAEPADSEEVTPAQPGNTQRPGTSLLLYLIIRKELAEQIHDWLHSKMDPLKEARDKLLYLRAIYEAGYLPRLLSYPEYCEEFGPMAKSSYYDWMGTKLNYSRSEIDGIIDNFPFE